MEATAMTTNSRHRLTELWPQIVDRLAREQSNAAYGLWPVASNSYDAGYHTITYSQLANIVNGLAWWIMTQIGAGDRKDGTEVLTYVGPNDMRLTAMILAAIKAGYSLFLTSPRNSPAAHRSLFEALKCRILITTDPRPPPVQPILHAVKPRCLTIPSIDELLNQQYPLFAYEAPFESGCWDPYFIMHTSGSTGMPKPIAVTQEAIIRHHANASQELALPQGATSIQHLIAGKRVMVTVPSFHGAGILQYLLWAVGFGCIPIAPAAVGIVSAHGLAEALQHTPAEIAILVPSVIADLAQNPEQLDYCAKHLNLILYIGGDLPQAIGDIVAAKIPLRCWWGASEVGIPHQLIPSGLGPNDWRYISFHSSVGAVFDPVSDNTYEFVIRKSSSHPQTCFAIKSQEHLDEYRTKDLFQPHPTVEHAWAWRGRADDIIVFLNGEKTNPVSMEQHIVAQNRELGGALVIGTQRFQAALLIEPATLLENRPLTTSEQAELIERVWPSVQEANAVAPAHAKVEKSLILVVDCPLIRAGKGTIQRAASVQQYLEGIEALYANADVAVDDDTSPGEELDLTDAGSIARFIRKSVCAVTGWPYSSEAYTTETFFEHGMDSLMALQLIRILRRGLNRPDLGLSTIYANPTVAQLSQATLGQGNEAKENDSSLTESMLAAHRALIEQIPKPKRDSDNKQSKDEPVTAVLTGSTGSVGTYLLRALLDRPGIHQVICLNRSADGGRATQKLRMAERGLSVTDLDERVTFLHADLSKPHLGLADKTYQALCAQAGLIVHNAWPVNFNLGLAAFRPQFVGLVNLFRLSAETTSGYPTPFVFISSVSAVATGEDRAAPEKVLPLSEAPKTNGYARSKFLSELLCETAAQQLRIPVTIARVGQVAGAVRLAGAEWNRKEWLPSLVIGSMSMGCLPDSLGSQFSEIDWLPVDLLADVLVDLVKAQVELESNGTGNARVYNLRNPQTTTWNSLLPSILEKAKVMPQPDRVPEVVSPSTWLERLDEAASKDNGDENIANPAIKLLDFYRDHLWAINGQAGEQVQKTPPMSVEQASAHSKVLHDMEAVRPEWMQKWVGEWMA